jgi:uncharacterized membrane protein
MSPADPATRQVLARTRLLLSFTGGIVAAGVASPFTSWQVAMLVGWIVAAGIFLIWIWTRIWKADGETTAEHSTRVDDSRATADLVLIAASVASLVAVAFGLVKAVQIGGVARGVIASIAVLAIALSWTVVHTVFTLRYASLYHEEGSGIEFHEEVGRLPDYHDFAYVAFTIGMTFQISDTDISSDQIRRAVLRHSLLSYVFGIVIVAIAINVVAGLVR